MKIPKILSHIWIGPKPPPLKWMNTWREKNPDWEYRLYDNEYLDSHDFQTRDQIDEYLKRGMYAGAADLLRYEILYKHGGFIAEADSECLLNIDELFLDGECLYTIYENEMVRGKLVSPILASSPGHDFVKCLIDGLKVIEPSKLIEPWKETGNFYVATMIQEKKPNIVIWPSYYMIPNHFSGFSYNGEGKIYANQKFATTQKLYLHKNGVISPMIEFKKKVYGRIALRKAYKNNRKLFYKL